ncbi:MAG: hypothetical protein IJB62_01605 [Alistipes sp.]|nr:hypothetical protein [Alistipes sp.]
MKRIALIILFIATTTSIVYAFDQYYETKQVVCQNCAGNGAIMTVYGAMYCPQCGGSGVQYIQVPVQSYNPTFEGCHRISLYNEDGKKLGTGLYYTGTDKVRYNGSSYQVISSDNRHYNKKLKGYDAYFNY